MNGYTIFNIVISSEYQHLWVLRWWSMTFCSQISSFLYFFFGYLLMRNLWTFMFLYLWS